MKCSIFVIATLSPPWLLLIDYYIAMKKIYILVLACAFWTIQAGTKPTTGFIENKGQIHDQNFKSNTEVKYLLCLPGMNIQLKQNSFSYDTYTVEQKNTETKRETALTKLKHPEVENMYQFHRVDVEFVGANTQPDIIAENPSETYYNYYTTGTSEQGVINVRSYKKITYKNIYPNIDLEFIAKEGKMKYNFILHYGADMNVIKWKYHGANTSEIKNSNISIAVKQGEFDEAIPESYVEYRNTRSDLRINFKQEKNTFGFISDEKVNINKGEILVIDPVLNILWATYFGGTKNDFISANCIDAIGNTYYFGCTSSLSLIATTGAYQTTYGGGAYDTMLFKFNPSGGLIWSTYFGGSLYEDGWGIVIDKANNLFVSGYTYGSTTFTTVGAHQTTFGGGTSDAFLAKFTSNGTRIWSTYYGGSGTDYSYSCQLDTTGNVFLSGITSSTNNISTPGSYQTTYGGGTYDGFLVKFNTNGVRQWGTYYGGPSEDAPQYCRTDKSGRVYLGGYSTSSISISTPLSHQSAYSAGWDCFLAKFTNNGSLLWSTYYGDTGDELIGNINCDSLNNVYITGCTTSSVAIASLGAYQTIYSGAGAANKGDGFLVKFDSSGVRQWGTYYGGTNDDGGQCIDFKGPYVYLSGGTQSMTQISTPNTFQNTLSSPFVDIFLVKFDLSGVRQWGTYIGGITNDIVYFMIFSQAGDIYLCGTADGAFPVTVGAYQTTLNGMIEGLIIKIRENSITGFNELENESLSILIYPNPNSGSFTIQTKEDVVIEIVNELGQLVKTVKLDANNNYQTNITGLADGVYCLKDKLSGSIIKNKIVVVR